MCAVRSQDFDQEISDLNKIMSDLKERYEKEIKLLDGRLREEVESKKKMSNEFNIEILKLKKRNENLEKEYFELRKMTKQKDEEVRHYAKSLKELESKHQAVLTSKKKEIEECRIQYQKDLEYYLSRLSHEESKSGETQDDLNNYIDSYELLRENFRRYVKDTEKQADQMKNELFTKDEELKRLHKDLKDIKTRLSSIYERRLKHDQRGVENALEFNTPSDVEKDFSEFLEGHRIDAWDIIEKTLSLTEDNDVQIRYLACMIFVAAYEQVEDAQQAVYDFFNNIIEHLIDEAPRRGQELCIKRKVDSCSSHFPITFEVSVEKSDVKDFADIVNDLVLSLKQTAHSCDLKCFENDVKQLTLERWAKFLQEKTEVPLLPAFSEDVITELNDYIQACIRLAWKMVTQIPPLQLEYSSSKFNKTMHRLTRIHDSNDSTEPGQCESIACYLWPALVEDGGRVIFPGEVLCKSAVS